MPEHTMIQPQGGEETPAGSVDGEGGADGKIDPVSGALEVPMGEEGEEGEGELIAGKFKSQDDLVKAYQELEKKLGSGGKPEGDGEKTTIGDPPAGDGEEKKAPTKKDGLIQEPSEGESSNELDLDAIATRTLENEGKLSAKDSETLSKAGLGKTQLDSYIAGKEALAQKTVNDLAEVVGGPDSMRELLGWAESNLSKSEINAYNQSVMDGNIDSAKLLLSGISARKSAAGSEPSLVKGSVVEGPEGVLPFESLEQMTDAVGDPKYDRDPKYRRQVDQRLGVTDYAKLGR